MIHIISFARVVSKSFKKIILPKYTKQSIRRKLGEKLLEKTEKVVGKIKFVKRWIFKLSLKIMALD